MADLEKQPLLSTNATVASYEQLSDLPPRATPTEYGGSNVDNGVASDPFAAALDDDETARKRKSFWIRARYYFPVLAWAPMYQKSYLLSDFIAGTSVAFMIIPQGLSYASLVNLDEPKYGLYGAFFPVIIYAIFGTSRQMSIGPEAVVALLTGAAVYAYTDQAEKLEIIAVLNFLVGAFTLIMGLLRLGFLDSIFSRATNRGFITGVALVVMVEQLNNCFGIPKDSHVCPSAVPGSESGSECEEVPHETSAVKILFTFLGHLGQAQWRPFLFSFFVFGYLITMDSIKRKYTNLTFLKFIPNVLIVVVFSILFVWALKLDELEAGLLPIFGDISGGFVAPSFPKFTSESLSIMAPSALVIVIVGFVESIIAGKLMAAKHNYALSDNRELVAFGMANLIASFFGAYTAFGSMPRTRMNDSVGAKSQMAGFITSIYVLIAILALMPMFKFLPRATASAIVMFAAYSLMEVHDFIYFYKMKAWFDLIIALTCIIVTFCIGVEVGVFFTLAICIGLLVKTVTRDPFLPIGYVTETHTFQPLSSKTPEVKWIDGILIIQFLDSMYYANGGLFKERLRRLELFGSLGIHPGSDVRESKLESVIFDFQRMNTIDISALAMLEEVFRDYSARKIRIIAVKLNSEVYDLFEKSGMNAFLFYGRNLDSIEEAVNLVRHSA